VGLLGKVAENMGDRNVNANGGGSGSIGCEEVNGDIEWPTAGEIGDSLGRFFFHIMFGADEVSNGGQDLKDGVDGIADVVMKAGFEFFGEAAGEEVVAKAVAAFGAEGTQGRLQGVKKREAEFAAKEEAISIGRDTMVLETAREGVEGNASGGGEEGREEVFGGFRKGGGLGEEMGGSIMVVKAVLKTPGGDVKDQGLGGGDGRGGGEKSGVIGDSKGWQVVTKDTDGAGWVAGRVPGGEVLGVDWRECMEFFGAPVRDAMGRVTDGADEGNEKGREGGTNVIAETEATAFQG
jgi:hypothetical protein